MHFEYRPELLDPSCYPPGRIAVAAGGDLQLGESSTAVQLDGVAALLDGDVRFGNLEGPLTERGQPAGSTARGRPTNGGGADPVRGPAGDRGAAAPAAGRRVARQQPRAGSGRGRPRRHRARAAIGGRRRRVSRRTTPRWRRQACACRSSRAISAAGMAPADEDALAAAVASARRGGAAVLVSLHFGREGVQLPSPAERRLAERLIDAGASAVLGHGPHVVRGVERRGRGVIAYSLGNLAFACRCTDEKDALVLRFTLDADGGVDDVVALPIVAGLAGAAAPPRRRRRAGEADRRSQPRSGQGRARRGTVSASADGSTDELPRAAAGRRAKSARYDRAMKMLWKPWFRREKKKAERLVENPLAVLRAAERASDRAQTARGPLARIWDDLQTALRLARAWSRRDYRGVTRGSIVLVVAGLLYLREPDRRHHRRDPGAGVSGRCAGAGLGLPSGPVGAGCVPRMGDPPVTGNQRARLRRAVRCRCRRRD